MAKPPIRDRHGSWFYVLEFCGIAAAFAVPVCLELFDNLFPGWWEKHRPWWWPSGTVEVGVIPMILLIMGLIVAAFCIYLQLRNRESELLGVITPPTNALVFSYNSERDILSSGPGFVYCITVTNNTPLACDVTLTIDDIVGQSHPHIAIMRGQPLGSAVEAKSEAKALSTYFIFAWADKKIGVVALADDGRNYIDVMHVHRHLIASALPSGQYRFDLCARSSNGAVARISIDVFSDGKSHCFTPDVLCIQDSRT